MLQRKQKALVVEGGAMRGIFAAGVLDAFIAHHNYDFDFCVGVSAGSTNLIGYLNKQFGRSEKIIKQYATSDKFINFRRFLKGGHLCDVEWLWRESYRREPLNHQLFCPLWVVTTNVITGQPHYHQMHGSDLCHSAIVASCAIPVVYRDYPLINDIPMTDGGIADSIPLEFAYQHGARDITVILSRPDGYRKRPIFFTGWLKKLTKEYPNLYKAIRKRHEKYNQTLSFMSSPPKDCKIRIISPPPFFPVKRFTYSKDKLELGYQQGLEAGIRFLDNNS
ncbi:patatin-like phospholipase family protein [Vibrio cholerae]|jgi:predicted patatin/cPLA2 family phospholipase|uniref:patatin-like phospholipase family protein n=1 Tax=Vibrio cholerae TaxID=666 RepID=UPI00226E12FF|nr:patatin family protein [Vibrio cholerae]MCX9594054.1 patatin family protein [Vibrio cholerae]